MKANYLSILVISLLLINYTSAIEYTFRKSERRMKFDFVKTEKINQRLFELEHSIKSRRLKMHKLGISVDGLVTGTTSPLYSADTLDTTNTGFAGYA